MKEIENRMHCPSAVFPTISLSEGNARKIINMVVQVLCKRGMKVEGMYMYLYYPIARNIGGIWQLGLKSPLQAYWWISVWWFGTGLPVYFNDNYEDRQPSHQI